MADETFDLRGWIRGQRFVGCGADLTDDDHFICVLSIADLTDIIDTQVCTCTGGSKADAIGIAIPGAIDDGMFDLGLRTAFDLGESDLANRLRDAREFDMARFFNERYDIPVFLCNNSNAAALGWYASQDEYENVTLHSQPAGWAVGGQGNVVNGRLVEGAHSIAGEIRHITDRLQYRHPLHFNAYDPADVLDWAL